MDLNKFGNFNWIEINSKDQNLNLTRTKRIHFCPFQFIFICWVALHRSRKHATLSECCISDSAAKEKRYL